MDVLLTELFELLVLRRLWSPDQFAAFTAGQLIAALLPADEMRRDGA